MSRHHSEAPDDYFGIEEFSIPSDSLTKAKSDKFSNVSAIEDKTLNNQNENNKTKPEISAAFSNIRFDRDNKVEFHGQYDSRYAGKNDGSKEKLSSAKTRGNVCYFHNVKSN